MNKVFDIPLNRENTWSTKWDLYKGKDIIPLWVADMDFQSPDFVQKAFQKRIDHGIYGYTEIPDELYSEVIKAYRKSSWTIEKEWIVFLPGLETVIHQIYNFIDKSHSVFVPRPIYPPFLNAAKHSNKKIIYLDLKNDNGRLIYDFEKFNTCATKNGWLMFANPHNPGGTVFNQKELTELANIIIDNDMYVLSDEIHSDFILESQDTHIHLAKISGMSDRVITIDSLSKTFNIAGLNCAYAVIPNQKIRKEFKKLLKGQTPSPSLFGIIATLACFKEGDSWKAELIEYLNKNRSFLLNEFSNRDDMEIINPKGTYLLWFKVINSEGVDLKKHFEDYGVGLSNGAEFGNVGWMRLNFGTNIDLLKKAASRIHKALDALVL